MWEKPRRNGSMRFGSPVTPMKDDFADRAAPKGWMASNSGIVKKAHRRLA